MLRLTACFLITGLILIVICSAGSPRAQSFATLTRLTNTPEHTLNLDPTISDDGRVVAFESSADLANTGGSPSFHLVRSNLSSFVEIGATRAVCPAMSGDGTMIVLASTEDLVGRNADRNIVLYDTLDQEFTQLTTDGSAVNQKISGDGSRVYVTTDAADLILIDTQTLARRVLVEDVAELSIVEGRAVGNDGMRVVYSAATAENQTQVFMFDGRDDSIRQLTNLGSRAVDVGLQPTISGDGRRVAFATRRRVTGASDGGVELYLLDLPTAAIPPRPIGAATIVNAAAQGQEPQPANIAPGSIASIRGNALALKTGTADLTDGELPLAVDGTTVTVNGESARIFYVSAGEVVFVVPSGLATGPAEFVVENGDGLSSKAEAIISATAPGVFTVAGNGRGEAIILNSDTLTPGPFDPSSGELRLSIFATGVRGNSVSVTINGEPAAVETVVPANLPGLDEIHIRVPAELRGAGTSTLVVSADGVRSNPVSLTLTGATPTPTPTPDSSPHIVISQVFGGGGNSGAPFRNDFIEIFNAGSSIVNLNGWSVQYASATASSWLSTPLTAVTLQPGQYYLIQESSGGSNGASLPTPDATGTIAMAAGSGKVALVKTSTTLTGACPNDPNIVDLAGYGSTANCFRGSAPAPTPSNINAILRAAAGCTDTRNNVADFAISPPNPRNTKFLLRMCSDP